MFTRMLRERSIRSRSPLSKAKWSTGAKVPDGQRLYAIGDIHGRLDLLLELHRQIEADIRERPGPTQQTVVYLGDYVDRGPSSYDVLDYLIGNPLPACDQIFLRGNHEELMLRFLNKGDGGVWLSNGGDATIASYGLSVPWMADDDHTLETLRRELSAAIPSRHLSFLQSLQLSHEAGDYFFVHAGVRPHTPLDQQRPTDLVWIREPFLLSDADFGKRVVHGHTISNAPEVRPNRIGIDTGAFYSGSLTCLVLEGTQVGFLRK